MVEQRGLEPLASALRTRRSAKLSYCPTSGEYSFEFQVSSGQFQVNLMQKHFGNSPQAVAKGRVALACWVWMKRSWGMPPSTFTEAPRFLTIEHAMRIR